MLRDQARGGWCPLNLVECFVDLHRESGAESDRDRIAV
jgi:hypothetical protein